MKISLIAAAVIAGFASAPSNAAALLYEFRGIGDRSETYDQGRTTFYNQSKVAGFFSFNPDLAEYNSSGELVVDYSYSHDYGFAQRWSATLGKNSLDYSFWEDRAGVVTAFDVSTVFEDDYLSTSFPEKIDFSKVLSSSYTASTLLTFRSGMDPIYSSGILTSLSGSLRSVPVTGPYGQADFETIAIFGVPEPTTWAMMLLGFGAIGFGMRRRRAATSGVSHSFAKQA